MAQVATVTATWDADPDNAGDVLYRWRAGQEGPEGWRREGQIPETEAIFEVPATERPQDAFFCVATVVGGEASEEACVPFTVPAAEADEPTVTKPKPPRNVTINALLGAAGRRSQEGGSNWRENEPADFAQLIERSFDAIDEDSWNDDDGDADWSLVTDSGSPQSPPNILRITTPQGFDDGSAPAASARDLTDENQVYVYLAYRLSANYKAHAFASKLFYLMDDVTAGNSSPFLAVFRSQGGVDDDMDLELVRQYDSSGQFERFMQRNLGSAGDEVVTRGVWHELELLLINSSAPDVADGQLHGWHDGTKLFEYTDVAWRDGTAEENAPGFNFIRLAPVWGGDSGDTAPEDFDTEYGHVYLGVPSLAPSAPANPSANAVSDTQIDLSWDDVSLEDGYKVERCQGSSCTSWSEIDVVGADVTSYSDTGLSAGTTYRYRIVAHNRVGSNTSAVAEATTQSSGGGAHPNEPSGLSQISENFFDGKNEDGWQNDGSSQYSIVTDADDPGPGDQVAEFNRSSGSGDGSATVTIWRDLPTSPTDLYVDFHYKYSPNYGLHNFVNKIGIVDDGNVSGGSNPVVFATNGGSGCDDKQGAVQFEVHIQGSETRTLTRNVGSPGDDEWLRGEYGQIEMYFVASSAEGVADGEVHVWLDGIKIIEYTDVVLQDGSGGGSIGFDTLKFANVWGGSEGCTTSEAQQEFLAKVYVSGS